MKLFPKRSVGVMVSVVVFCALVFVSMDASAQSTRRRTSTPIPVPTATPTSEPQIISRAEDFPDEPQAIRPDPNERKGADAASILTLETLGDRIKNLEASRLEATRKIADPDEKQRRLLLNIDILTRAEQRSEGLRRQVFEMIEKENAVKTKLDTLEYDMRPEVIERSTSLIGSLRPEEIRASRRKSLEAERTNLQSLLTEIQKTRAALDINLQRSDALVEKLRTRFEKEIDAALAEEPDERNP